MVTLGIVTDGYVSEIVRALRSIKGFTSIYAYAKEYEQQVVRKLQDKIRFRLYAML